jgi:hypothetical protein
MLVKDLAAPDAGQVPVQRIVIRDEAGFYDGPISPRVAVLDFDPASGALRPGVPCVAPDDPTRYFRYGPKDDPEANDLETPDFIATSVFGTVHHTMAKFEEADILGRHVAWAFAGPQLLVVPRAGEWENACYERDSRSLQFFYFPHRETGTRVHTALSEDIVAHETTHAVLDGIAPDLYSALSPQSLALHEAIADLGALSIALGTRLLQDRFLATTGGDLAKWQMFRGLAQRFAEGTQRGSVFLRDLDNELTMKDVRATDPHEMSQVLTGAMYALWRHLYESAARHEKKAHPELTPVQIAGSVLWRTREIYERMAFRALDYLPPGEATFADYARAVLAADEAGNPNHPAPRTFLAKQFVRRGLVKSHKDLHVRTRFAAKAVSNVDPEDLLQSDYAAYEFANRNRKLLGIPRGIPFKVLPRLATQKLYYHRRGDRKETVSEVLFKVSWTEDEPQNIPGLPRVRHVVAGTTLAIDRATHRVRVLLTMGKDGPRKAHRDALLENLVATRRIVLADDGLDVNRLPRRDVVRGEIVGGALRVRNTAHLLHVCAEV